MEYRLFDCLNDAYKFSLNDPAYMHLIENNFDKVSESLDSTKKVVYENLTLIPGRGVGIDLEIKNNNVSYHFVVLAQMEIKYDPDTYGDIYFICAQHIAMKTDIVARSGFATAAISSHMAESMIKQLPSLYIALWLLLSMTTQIGLRIV